MATVYGNQVSQNLTWVRGDDSSGVGEKGLYSKD